VSNQRPFLQSTVWKAGLFPIVRLFLALLFVAIPIAAMQALVKSLGLMRYGDVLFMVLTIPIAFLAYWAYVRLIERRPLRELSLVGAPKELGQGILFGVGLFTIVIVILWAAGFYHVTGTSAWTVLIESVSLSVFSGFIEELITRGIIFRIMEESLGTWNGLALSAILFGSMHLGNPNATLESAAAIALEAGLLLGGCYVLTRRLWLAIGLHLAWNFTQGGIFGVPVSGTTPNGILRSTLTGPAILSGGPFGAEASIVAVVVCVSGFLFIIVRAYKKGNVVRAYWNRRPDNQTT